MTYKKYTGKEPCVGCGRSGEETPRYGKHSLCMECELAYDTGKSIIKQQKLYETEKLITVRYRTCLFMFEGEYRSEQTRSLDDGIIKLLESIDLNLNRRAANISPETINVGSGGSNGCSWVIATIYKKQWEAISTMITGFSKFINSYVGDVNELEKKAFKEGQNLLLNLNSDKTFLSKAEDYAVKK